jgi:hypothetical protein
MVEKTRNAGTMSEAAYYGKIRSVLRQGFRYWKPAQEAKKMVRRKYEGDNKRQKWEYQCATCEEWFTGKETQIDHIVPVGSLRSLGDIPHFIDRLTPESGFQCLCKGCHQEKTNSEKLTKTIEASANVTFNDGIQG